MALLDGLTLYRRYIGISIRSQMQYRGSFIMQTLAHLLVTLVEFLAIWSLFLRFDNLLGWKLAEVAFFYGSVNISFALSDSLTRGFDRVPQLIKTGDFDRVLLRPRSTVLQLIGYELTLKRIGRLTQGLVILLLAGASMELRWTLGKVALQTATIAGASCLFMGLYILQATLAFWTTESLEIVNSILYGGMETAQYPLDIYLPWFRKFFTFFIPLACVGYFPILAIIEKEDSLGSPAWFQHAAPLAGILFLLVALSIWRLGIRHYSSTGS
jgi:ABC-2 type transport system permease protein